MSLFRYYPRDLERNYWDIYDWPQSMFNQHFGHDLLDMSDMLWPSHQTSRPTRQQMLQRSGASQLTSDDSKFAVKVDVSHFSPEEITVKAKDNNIEIYGKHEEKMDKHGWVSRQFTRRYALPDDCEADKLVSNLSSNGILTVEAPKKRLEAIKGDERVIPINVLTESPQQQSIQSKPSGDQPNTMETN